MSAKVVQVRRPKAICFDILGTASKSGFLERILFPFLKLNLDSYLSRHWDKPEFKRLFKRIQDSSVELNKSEPSTPIVLAHNTNQAKSSLLNFLNFCTENGVQSPPVTQLRFKVWFEGYQSSKLLTPIYSDVPASMRRWFAEGIKFYVFSNTWVEAQKALLRNTTHGDLTNLIAAHFDNDFGSLTESDSWRRFCNQVHHKPEDTLFLTKSVQEGRAAQDAGLQVVLVLTHRHNVKAVNHEDRARFPYVRTLNDLQWVEGAMMPGTAEPLAVATQISGASGAPTSAGGGGASGVSVGTGGPSTTAPPSTSHAPSSAGGIPVLSPVSNVTQVTQAPSQTAGSGVVPASSMNSSAVTIASSHAPATANRSTSHSTRKPSQAQ